MKKAYVVGFFDRAEVALQREFSDQLQGGSLVWLGLGQRKPTNGVDVAGFKGVFMPATATASSSDEFLVVVADLADWSTAAVKEVAAAVGRKGKRIQVETLRDAQNGEAIAALLQQFGLSTQPQQDAISGDALRAYLKSGRVYCVRPSHQAAYEPTLKRAGFECVYGDHFEEFACPAGQNSNLIAKIGHAAEQYQAVLYAFSGLRTLSSQIKRTGKVIEAPTTAAVVMLFKQRLLASGTKTGG